MMSEEINKIVDEIIARFGKGQKLVIPILQGIQKEFNYLPEEALERVCETTDITASQVFGISTFYNQFRHTPVGEHIIRVCVGTACHVKGALQVYDAFKRELKLEGNEDTDSNGLFTLEKVACLGCCTIAPVVQIDNHTYGHVTTDSIADILTDFLDSKSNSATVSVAAASDNKTSQGEIRIGLGSCCVASGSAEVREELEKTLERNKIHADVKHVGCVGICNQVPLLEIHKPNETPAYYTKIKPYEVSKILKQHFTPENPINKLKNNFYGFFENLVLGNTPFNLNKYAADKRDTPVSEFLEEQFNIATEYRGEIKPSDINEYKKLGGFKALHHCIKDLKPDNIIDIIDKSGLKGRGGAGFPSSVKWKMVKEALEETKYIICNGDEGDPGAFMDRMLLESYPYRIIEGILIAAYATVATEGILYIRAEYPLAVTRVNEALSLCYENNLLGKNILGTDFSFELKVFEGAGAFVCGEETALIASVEGKRGMPSTRPPYPASKGLYGKPTLINNTETFSLVSWIVRNGSESFSSTGSENSKGTKVFALAGKINRGGLIEVPMGITIKTIVEKIGGGVANGRKFKAVQIGGPSGGCIPASMADTPIDFESLKEAGAMMGSGGMIVMDDSDCMVDIARYFLSFTQDQSCGKCTFCRIGTRKMLDILNKICEGNGTEKDLEQLEKLALSVKKSSLCGLGKTAPNPVLSTLRYFREEYESHLEGKCPTGTCKEIITYSIDDNCNGCTKCAQKCPTDAIELKPYEIHSIDTEKCIKCDICRQVCPVNAVKVN